MSNPAPVAIKKQLGPDQLAAAQEILSHDFSNLRERLKLEGDFPPDRVPHLVSQFSAFLALHVIYPNQEFTPPWELDQVWHSFILNTRSYMDFCEEHFGSYLHHTAIIGVTDLKLIEIPSGIRTINLAKDTFKNMDEKIWNLDRVQKFACTNDCLAPAV